MKFVPSYMNRILLFIFIGILLSSCKTPNFIGNENFLQLDIVQNRQIAGTDSIEKNNILPTAFTASKDSFSIITFKNSTARNNNISKKGPGKKPVQITENEKLQDEPVDKIPKSKGIRIFIPVVFLLASIWLLLNIPVIALGIIGIAFAIIIFLLLNTNIFSRHKTKSWQIPVSLLILMAGIVFVIVVASTEILALIGIVFIVISLMVFLYAIINNLINSQPKPKLSEEQKRKSPYNKYALWAGIFFLLFLISMVIAYFVYVPYLSLLIFLSFLIAFVLSIIALINMSRKSEYERGKPLSIFVLVVSLLPILLFFTIIGERIVEDVL